MEDSSSNERASGTGLNCERRWNVVSDKTEVEDLHPRRLHRPILARRRREQLRRKASS